METNPEILKLTRIELESELKSLMALKERISGMPLEFIHIDSIDKIRRYGYSGYKRKFHDNTSGNISSHMKTFLYIRDVDKTSSDMIDSIIKEKTKIDKMIGPNK